MITRLPPVDQRIYSLPIEKQVRELGDYLMRYRRESEFLLNGNIDSTNVRSITTDQLVAGKAKIGTAMIDELIVGSNVGLGTAQDATGVTTIVGGLITTDYIKALGLKVGDHIAMGPDATISWSKVTSQPYIPSTSEISSIATTITANYVATPNLITNIARVNKSLELGQQSDNSAKTLTFHAGVSSRNSQLISTITDGYSDLEIKSASITLNNFDGAYIYNLKATSSSFFGTVNFSGANVLGLNYIKPYSQANWCYVDATSSGVAFRDSSGSLLGVTPYA